MSKLRALLVLTVALGPAANPIDIKEWKVPWENSGPRDPFMDSSGRVWFVGQRGHYVAYLDPKSGEFKRFDLESGSGPHNVVVDADGTPWFTGNLKRYIGKVDPKNGKITKYELPDSLARDPHTLIFDRKGDLWFTVQGGNFVGHFDKKAGQAHLIRVPTANARPYGIIMDSKGLIWFNEFNSNKLGVIDPAAMRVREIEQPRPQTRGRRIGVTSDDRIWYVDYAKGYLGVYDQKTKQFKEWATPSGVNSQPYGMAVDDQDRIWFVEGGIQPNKFVGFDPKTERFFSSTDIPSFGTPRGTVRHMMWHKPTREIWFGTDAGTIGRAKIP